MIVCESSAKQSQLYETSTGLLKHALGTISVRAHLGTDRSLRFLLSRVAFCLPGNDREFCARHLGEGRWERGQVWSLEHGVRPGCDRSAAGASPKEEGEKEIDELSLGKFYFKG